jgi:outer membrane protein assembly factor BamB
MTALVAALLSSVLAVPGAPVFAEPAAPLVYTPAPTGPRVSAVPLGGGAGGRVPWKVTVSFRCQGQTVDGSFSTRVGRDGRFEEATERLVTHADVGSDTQVTLRGRLTEAGARGTIDADARAYDNAGTTFECTKRGIKWQAAAESDPAAPRADGFLPTDADAVSATADAVFVDTDRGDKASIVRRLDPATGKTVWSRRVSDADRIAAGAERVWVADAAQGRVIGLDARTGAVASTTDVGPGTFDAIAPGANQPIALTSDGVWVATAQGLLRLDPASGAVIEQLPCGPVVGVAAGPNGLVTTATVSGPDGRPAAARVARIDPATRQAAAETQVDDPPDLVSVAAGDAAVVVARFDDTAVRLDPATLATLGPIDVVTDGNDVTAAAPGAWVATKDGLVAIDGSGAQVVRVRDLRGALAAGGTTVWVLDRGAGGLVRVRGG